MRKLLNTLYIMNEAAYATLDGENIVIKVDGKEIGRRPLHALESIICFTYMGASPALMGKCARDGIDFVFCTPRGRFLARTCGEVRGNVLLRRTQYRAADDLPQSCCIARNFIFGKISNARRVLDRMRRDHAERIDAEQFQKAEDQLKGLMADVLTETSMESLRGLEGAAANIYFGLFDDMILRNKTTFFYQGRSRRPPMDCVNALLSFVYTLLGNDCAAALESVGLDPYVGFMHRDRPGRTSLALDLLEELRPCMTDRFVLTLMNNGVMTKKDFEVQESGAVLLKPDSRKKLLSEWQEKKKLSITHPFLKEKVEWGLLPYVQAMLLARYLRDDLDEYPPFLWK